MEGAADKAKKIVHSKVTPLFDSSLNYELFILIVNLLFNVLL